MLPLLSYASSTQMTIQVLIQNSTVCRCKPINPADSPCQLLKYHLWLYKSLLKWINMSSSSNNFTHSHLGATKCSHSHLCLASTLHSHIALCKGFFKGSCCGKEYNSNFLTSSSYSQEPISQSNLTSLQNSWTLSLSQFYLPFNLAFVANCESLLLETWYNLCYQSLKDTGVENMLYTKEKVSFF